jgi:hypothetical protein
MPVTDLTQTRLVRSHLGCQAGRMSEPWRLGSEGWTPNAKVRVGRLAERQWGRVSRAQLQRVGISKAGVVRWVREGYLHCVHPGVYAVGHCAPTSEGDLAAALLYAGPGAALGGETALWWFGLIDEPPRVIETTTQHRRRSRPGVRVHDRSDPNRVWHRGFPITPVAWHCSNTPSARRMTGFDVCSPRLSTAVCSTSTLCARSWVAGAPGAPTSARRSGVISPGSRWPVACSRNAFWPCANPPGYRCRNAMQGSRG